MAHFSPVLTEECLKSHTEYMTFNTDERREFVRITDEVQSAVEASGVAEGMVLVSAMHITAGVWVNDDEPGIQADTLEWLDKIAPPSWKDPSNEVAHELLPERRRLPPPPRRRGQRRRAPEEPARPPAGGAADHRGPARPRPVAGGLLLRVRRPPRQAAGHQGHWRIGRLRRPGAAPASLGRSSRSSSGRRRRRPCSTRSAPAGTVFYRLLFAALVLLAIWRPRRSDVSGAPGAAARGRVRGLAGAMNLQLLRGARPDPARHRRDARVRRAARRRALVLARGAPTCSGSRWPRPGSCCSPDRAGRRPRRSEWCWRWSPERSGPPTS